MFEHLDDPRPPAATTETRAAVTGRMTDLRRRRTTRSLIAAAGAVLLSAATVIAAQTGNEPIVPAEVSTGESYDIPDPATTVPPPPVGVTGHRANKLDTQGPLDGWLLETYPIPVENERAFLRLGVRTSNGPEPRPVSIDYGDGRTVRPKLPPCPPPASVPEADRTGEHAYYSFERDTAGRPSFWNHTYDRAGSYFLTVTFESGCGAPVKQRSSARFQLTIHPKAVAAPEHGVEPTIV